MSAAGVQFKATKAERLLIDAIAQRATALLAVDGIKNDTLWTAMDIEATHCSGRPLDLSRLLAASNFNFAHDVFGINQHLDRETGKLTGHFLPRYSLRQKVMAA